MTRPKAVNDIALRLVDLLHATGVEDAAPATIADTALQALGVTALEINAVT